MHSGLFNNSMYTYIYKHKSVRDISLAFSYVYMN